jgi:hypothetical protein
MGKDALGHGSDPRGGARSDAISRGLKIDFRRYPGGGAQDRATTVAKGYRPGPGGRRDMPGALGGAPSDLWRSKRFATPAAHQEGVTALKGKKL